MGGKTVPVPCVPTAFVAKTLPVPCVPTAFVAKTLPVPCVPTAFVAKTVPLPCGPQMPVPTQLLASRHAAAKEAALLHARDRMLESDGKQKQSELLRLSAAMQGEQDRMAKVEVLISPPSHGSFHCRSTPARSFHCPHLFDHPLTLARSSAGEPADLANQGRVDRGGVLGPGPAADGVGERCRAIGMGPVAGVVGAGDRHGLRADSRRRVL